MCVDPKHKSWTPRELAKAPPERVLIAIDGRVHDCAGWLRRHPGGAALLRTYAGRDASDVFAAFHGPEVYKTLKAFDVGCVVEEPVVENPGLDGALTGAYARARRKETAAFRKLREELWREGAFERSVGAIAVTVARLLIILALAMWFTLRRTEWVTTCRATGAVFLGLFWQQSLLLAHDCCHRCLTRNTKVDKRLGYVFGTLIGGVGAGWWNMEHCEHHAVTQVIDGDPSAGSHPVLCPHTSMIDKLGPILRAVVNFQALYYVPICVFVGRVNLHIISILKAPTKDKLTDLCLMAGYAAYNALILQSVEPGARATYFVVSNTVCGVLHLVLNMNHYPMPMLSFDTAMDLGFFRFQCVTTLNIASNGWTSWYYGGLENQIEHHLFPLMPRHYLPKITQRVKKLCEDHAVPFTVAAGFFDANNKVMKTLNNATRNIDVVLSRKDSHGNVSTPSELHEE